MRKGQPDIRYITKEDFENLNSEECRTLGSSSLIVCVVKRNEKQSNVQPDQPSQNDLQRVTGKDALLSWDQPGAKERTNYRRLGGRR